MPIGQVVSRHSWSLELVRERTPVDLCNSSCVIVVSHSSLLVCVVASIASAAAPNLPALCAARFVLGISVGFASTVAPMYISEMSPAEARGRLVTLFQIAVRCLLFEAFFAPDLLNTLQYIV